VHPTVLVIGAGHAGIEAALAATRIGAPVIVVTANTATIGQTPCNPSVGGIAKGHLVAEIEALGGFMGRCADACAIQGRVLNQSKGPAVRSTRVQVDKVRYGARARAVLTGTPGVKLVEGSVETLLLESGDARVRGVRLRDGSEIPAAAVVVTTGTFLGGVLHTGLTRTPGGRVGEPPAAGLSRQLAALGFSLRRLKTGTPPRLRRDSIDLAQMQPQGSDEPFPRFTAPDEPDQPNPLPRVECHLTSTQPSTHDLVRAHLHESPMYSGRIEGRGPRYCPSLEDKVVRFAGRDHHHVFVEPEGLDSELVYPNGISTSLPAPVQERLVRTIPGLSRAVVVRPGYAVEYDAVDARLLDHRLASTGHRGLFFAGQINGTSGYEEAAAQGLVAGANAALEVVGRGAFAVGRDQGYVGVLVDDLVTQGCDEPYRMFTSRAEYRLVLREDNAEERLSSLGHDVGLLDQARIARVRVRAEWVEQADAALAAGRPPAAPAFAVRRAAARRLYAGYLDRQRREIERIRGEGTSDLPLPADLDYFGLSGLAREAAERLDRVRPATTGQAARVPGMTPAALMTVWAHARASARRAG
jgi:tRNA uridine 5-carboxymethylaminomethyl modification enzyme